MFRYRRRRTPMNAIRTAMRTLLIGVVLAFMAGSACMGVKSTALPSTTTSTSSTSSTTGPPTVDTAADPVPIAVVPVVDEAQSMLSALVIATPHADGYDRDLFKHWTDADRNQCDTRQEVLIAESTTPAQVDRYGGCTVVAGDWISIYDGIAVTDPAELDVDHMVPLKNAWMSGMWSETPQRREQFANSLDNPDHLIAVTASSNRSKGDKSPDQWKPPVQDTWCEYAIDWVTVKYQWEMSITEREHQSLIDMLAICPAA